MSILQTLRNKLRPWLGRGLAKRSGAEAELTAGRIKTSRPDASFRLLPYMDPCSVVTDAERRLFRGMMKDAVVRPALMSKVVAVATLDLSVPPEDEENKADKRCAEFCKYATMRMNGGIVGLAEELLPPLLIDGFILGEKARSTLTRGKFNGKWTIDRINVKHPDLYDAKVNEYGVPTRVEGRGIAHGEKYDVCEFVTGRFLPMYGNPMGTSDLQACYQAYWRRDTAWKLRHGRLKNLSNGVYLTAKYVDPNHQPVLEAACKAAVAGGFAVVPDTAQMEVLDLAGGSNEEFRSAIQDLDQEIIRCLTGGVLQMSQGTTGTGSYAQSKVHQTGADLWVWHLADVLARILNTEVYPDLCELNYVGFSDFPRASFGGVSDEALAAALVIDEGLAGMGLELSKKEIYERYRRSPPIDDDDAIKPAPKTPPMLPPGGAMPGANPFPPKAAKFAESLPSPADFLAASQSAGIATLTDICITAFARYKPGSPLFTPMERNRLQDSLAATIATADLTGRKRLRDELASKLHSLPRKYNEEFENKHPRGHGGKFGHGVPESGTILQPDEASALIAKIRAGQSESKNKGLDGGPESIREPMVVSRIPLSEFDRVADPKHPEDGTYFDFLKDSTDQARVDEYTANPIDTPIVVGVARNSGKPIISDGGHRLMAAKNRGDQDIAAIIPQSLHDKLHGTKTFADIPDLSRLAEPVDAIEPLIPWRAVEYFRSLVPGIVRDAAAFVGDIVRRSFTLAVTTEETLLASVQETIAKGLETGQGSSYDVQVLLEAAGVAPENSYYAESVTRTAAMTSMVEGYETQRMDPDIIEFFPWWRWDGIRDGRERPRHGWLDGRYYPASVKFKMVQGDKPEDVISCRCVPTALYADDVEELIANGAKVQEPPYYP